MIRLAGLIMSVLVAAILTDSPGVGHIRLTAAHSPMPSECGDSGQSCRQELIGSTGWKVEAFTNYPLTGSATATEAVIVIHGTGRNAAGYFASMLAAASKAGVAGHTMVIAPWFKTSQDKPANGEATWTSGAWKEGDGATSPTGLSSFTVVDQVLATLADRRRFPNLRRATLVGHSAGAQFTQRYAALGQAPNALALPINFVVANPSSFLYFGPTRPNGSGGFAVPENSACTNYNDYKYGMRNRTGYPAQLSPAQAAQTYTHRSVTLLTGGADTVNNGDLDTDCGAMLEGQNRAQRAENYIAYIHEIAPSAPQSRVVIPNIAHDGDAMFTSPLAWPALFGVQYSARQ